MKKSIILLLSALICCISCSKIDDLENRVSTIEKQIGELQSAYQNGKIIKEVTPYVGDDYTGWTISFSDGQSINIYNGNDGADAITPIFRINSEGYWEVSYDNGESFSLLTDKEGNGVTGKGEDGVSVRVVISEDGRYVFELYQGSNPEDVIESIETPISSSKANSIKSIVKDEYTGVIYLEMADGTKYEFNLNSATL